MKSRPLAAPFLGHVHSPLLRGWLACGEQGLDPWLAAANGVALTFLTIAMAGAGGFRQVPETSVPEVRLLSVDEPILTELSPASAASVDQVENPPEAEEPLPAEDLPPPPVWREAPEMIEPVQVVEPDRTPPPQPPKPLAAPPPRVDRRPAASRPVRETSVAVPPTQSPSRVARSGLATGPAPSPARQGDGGAGRASRAGSGNGPGWATSPPPPYPAFARRDRFQGTPLLSISVSNGVISNVRALTSSGSAALDAYTISYLKKHWKAKPGTTHTYTQRFRFVLQ